jgi:hypothetical protein
VPPADRTATSLGPPVTRTPAAASAARVEREPAAPKSKAWLFAWLTMSTPVRASVRALPGGAWNAKQLPPPPPHFDTPPDPNVPS